VADLLDGHEIDFALGVMPDAPVRFSRITLFEDVYMCAMRSCHMLARGKLTLHSFAAAKHLAVRPAGEATNLIDHLLESRGLERRMALTVNQFLVVPAIIGNTDLVATLFQRIAEQLDTSSEARTSCCDRCRCRRFRRCCSGIHHDAPQGAPLHARGPGRQLPRALASVTCRRPGRRRRARGSSPAPNSAKTPIIWNSALPPGAD
jgi:LysR substrate binding domain